MTRARAASLRCWFLAVLSTACALDVAIADAEDITLEGGEATVDDASGSAYDHVLPNVHDATALLEHSLGEEGFRRNFARTPVRGRIAIGPKFNNVSCIACHSSNGRGEPTFARAGSEAVVKISAGAGIAAVPGGPIPVPRLGLQLRDHAIRGTRPDAKLQLTWVTVPGGYADGTPYELRRPLLAVDLRSKSLPAGAMISMRRPPPIFGSGLIDAVEAGTIIAHADPDDSDGNGISGKANIVWDSIRRRASVGKFGWKAGSPTAAQQIATAYAIDMGVTNPLMSLGDRPPDIDRRIFDRTVFYTLSLAVPRARAQETSVVQEGQKIFTALNCGGCHLPTLVTGRHAIAALSNQTIHPFTDLLLHDMGPDLADGRPEFSATGSEWRTPPLWGIGLTAAVLQKRQESYLHDGRARSLEEAILWHGGEAEGAKEGFRTSAEADRAALVQFLRSL